MPPLLYQVEDWQQVWREIQPLLIEHWKEIAADQGTIRLNPDYAQYAALGAQQALHVVTVRHPETQQLVGYHVSLLKPHLHYKQSLSAFTDIYYLMPLYRQGHHGVRLFRFVERTLKKRGVQKMFTGTKMWLDVGRLFERLGWTETERLYTKVIGD